MDDHTFISQGSIGSSSYDSYDCFICIDCELVYYERGYKKFFYDKNGYVYPNDLLSCTDYIIKNILE